MRGENRQGIEFRNAQTQLTWSTYTIRFEKTESANPALRVRNPISAISGKELAVFGNSAVGAATGSAAATATGSGAATGSAAAVSTGGGSTTWASSTGSPVGATAATGAVSRASRGAASISTGVASTGSLVSLASSTALDFAYTTSSPQVRPG